jgi:hypothetical protein
MPVLPPYSVALRLSQKQSFIYHKPKGGEDDENKEFSNRAGSDAHDFHRV